MSFSEKIKKEVKEKSAFRCCRCQDIGIDIHHIVPEKDGGNDDFSNAAPLCQNCHDQFGDNESKRKEIIQMRDWWYGQCEKLYSKQDTTLFSLIDKKLEEIKNGQAAGVDELKEVLKKISDKAINNISAKTANTAASAIINGTYSTLPIIVNPEPIDHPSALGPSLLGEKIHFCSHCGFGYKVSNNFFYSSYYGQPYSITCPKCNNVEYFSKPLL